jgi:hypothetical protein
MTKKAKAPTKTSVKRKRAPAAPTEATTKKQLVINLLAREGGATLDEMMKATGWQGHSVRGFCSGALKKKMGLTIVRNQHAGKSDTYCIVR